jgi:hypothetical protein
MNKEEYQQYMACRLYALIRFTLHGWTKYPWIEEQAYEIVSGGFFNGQQFDDHPSYLGAVADHFKVERGEDPGEVRNNGIH